MGTIDYSKYGLDPTAAVPAANEERYMQLAAQALTLETQLAVCDDDEDREFLTSRLEEAWEAADGVRRHARMTKSEAKEVQGRLIANNQRSVAQQHLSAEATRGAPGVSDAQVDHDQQVFEQRMKAMEDLHKKLVRE